MAKASKYVYFFGEGKAHGRGDQKPLLGGKGAGLAEMTRIGVPVPPGFTITTEVCTYYTDHDGKYPSGLKGQVKEAVEQMEEILGTRFGSTEDPMLVSVRSGAAISMPGMMDTVLNLGLNDETVEGLAASAGGEERFAWDSYRRFIQMYGNVVMGIEAEEFEEILEKQKEKREVTEDTDLDADDWREVVEKYKKLVQRETKESFPQEPEDQLWGSIGAVFGSWDNPRARRYRELNDIPHDLGTAVNVQAMVYGNRGEGSATGVAFTRNPATGEDAFYGEWLPNAQGEDVVAGIRTPLPITPREESELPSLKEKMPKAYEQLLEVRKKLEENYTDMQDLEFTVQEGRLWILQTRTGKRTAQAAIRMAVEMEEEGLIDRSTAVKRIDPAQLDQLLHPSFEEEAKSEVVARGLPASPGAAVGQVVFTATEAEEWADEGKTVILVRVETSPEDIGGMDAAEGILTARGGMTSHAAVVARGMGKCCVAGCEAIDVDYGRSLFRVDGRTVKRGDWVSIDGSSGEVMLGEVPTKDPVLSGEYETLMGWADEIRDMKVRTNADTPEDAGVARRFGAEGIGLCRTEHMFFEGKRLNWMRETILADSEDGRRAALKKLLPIQREDFEGIFEAMDGLPVTIRLLDPPLHEFLPHAEEAIRAVADELGAKLSQVRRRAESLAEFNPMLGHRGCRLGLTYPEISEMQARAIFEAACNMAKKGVEVFPEVMIPLVGALKEFTLLKELIVEVATEVMEEKGVEIDYMVGTMIEIPRACLVAEEIGAEADFFSFGTNDLTQMGFGYSRDDAGRFLPQYIEQEVLPHDPFQSLDIEGIGQLVTLGVERGRLGRSDLKIGVCGEHGGDPKSVTFFYEVGLDYVSCSPYRVPIARLAAAQAALEEAESAGRETPSRKAKADTSRTKRTRERGKEKRRSGKPPKKV